MSTIVRNKAKGLAVVLSTAMILSATATPMSDAKVKKPKLSKTKVSVEVGAKKKVTVKNAKKVTWTIDKAGKKAISLSKKSKKGATINGKAEGKAKITVKMKYGKKTLKKTIKVTVTKAAVNNATPTPTATPAPSNPPAATQTPTATPEPTKSPEEELPPLPDGFDGQMVVDLTTAVDEGLEPVPYDAEKGLIIKDISLFKVELPQTLPTDSHVNVIVTGVQNGEVEDGEAENVLGFRCYMTPGSDNSLCSEIANSYNDDVGLEVGPFEWKFSMTNDVGEATHIQFKGIQHGTNIKDIEISKIILQWQAAAE